MIAFGRWLIWLAWILSAIAFVAPLPKGVNAQEVRRELAGIAVTLMIVGIVAYFVR